MQANLYLSLLYVTLTENNGVDDKDDRSGESERKFVCMQRIKSVKRFRSLDICNID